MKIRVIHWQYIGKIAPVNGPVHPPGPSNDALGWRRREGSQHHR